MNRTKIVIAGITFLILMAGSGCTDFIEADYVGYEETEDVWANSRYAHGVLDKIYDWINDNADDLYGIESDYLTDNAVQNNSVSRFATGGASASYYSPGWWDFHYRNIVHVNQYLEYGQELPINILDTSLDVRVSEKLFRYGEAHFLRAWSESELLKQYGGPGDGAKTEMLGIPLLRGIYTTSDMAEIPRSSYDDCVEAILSDLDTALAYCPFDYDGSSDLTEKQYSGRATQRAALALKSRVLLFAASPAYNTTNEVAKWEAAANSAYDAIMMDGGLGTLGILDYENNEEHKDLIWKTLLEKDNNMENNHFPPSFYGSGRCNPSQNLVDAFPMANGTPIYPTSISLYDPSDPYANRDERFYKYIVHNGEALYDHKIIQTYIGGDDAKGGLRNDATRTGYYMQRFTTDAATDSDPRVTEGKTDRGFRFVRLLDRQEIYLNFCEAANEVGTDPQANLPGFNFSAYDVFLKVRERGGDDAWMYPDYLLRTGQLTQETFRQLVKDERRIEFCFRGFRYWDLRRWLEPLDLINETVKGMEISFDNSLGVELYDYKVIDVEPRNYGENTYYGPIPYSEVYSSNALIQNFGW